MNDADVIPLADVDAGDTDRTSDDVLTIEEAARYLKIGRTTMYALIRAGEVESVEIGRCRRVPLECLKDYVKRLLQRRRDRAA